jgi:hypothetical protein
MVIGDHEEKIGSAHGTSLFRLAFTTMIQVEGAAGQDNAQALNG